MKTLLFAIWVIVPIILIIKLIYHGLNIWYLIKFEKTPEKPLDLLKILTVNKTNQ